MLLIVAHHYVVNSGLMDADGPILMSPMSSQSLFLLLFGAWGKTGINCFVLITGYFMCKSRITAKKFAKLVGEWLLYRYLIYIIFILSDYQSFSLKEFVKTIVPITQATQNFTSCFVLFWLFIPFLNILIAHMKERQHFYLLVLTGFTYVFLGTFHRVTMNYVSWFMVLYLIASFIRIYPKKWMSNKMICGIMLCFSILLSCASVIICAKTGHSPYWFVTDSNTILALMVGIFSFLLFKNIKIQPNRIINTVAASTFGVLLIHAHSDTMRQWLWKDVLDNVGHYGDRLMPLYAICCVLGIFIVCVLIDIIRINLLEKPFFKLWDKYWERFYNWFQVQGNKVFNKMNID